MKHKTVSKDENGQRLDLWLSNHASVTRSQASRWISGGRVRVNDNPPLKSGIKLEEGWAVSWQPEAPTNVNLVPEAIPIEFIYEDDQLAVINKPSGLVVHPAAGHASGTLVNALLHSLSSLGKGIGGEGRPGIVHRIDKETSGILLVTKTDKAHLHLAQQFQEHSIGRSYTALAWGELKQHGRWEGSIRRDPKDRKRMCISEEGKKALTDYALEKVFFQTLSLFRATLHTGRTHQIRVHAAHHGFPLVGDAVYGQASRAARQARERSFQKLFRQHPQQGKVVAEFEERGRQFLHAHYLSFVHPTTLRKMEFSCPLPHDLQSLMVALGHEGNPP